MARLMFKIPKSWMTLDQAGFTLIELFIAIVILAIGLLGTAALTTGVVRGNLSSRNMTSATAIAQSCFEENRRVGYSNVGSVPPGGSNNCISGTASVTSGGVSFTRSLAIDTSVSNIKTLTVTVSWSDGAAGNKSITFKTVLAAA